MSLTTKQTPSGQVVVGDLPADFLRIPQATPTHQTQYQQMSSDEMTARMLQSQQMGGTGYGAGFQLPSNVKGRLSVSLAQAKLTKNYGITKMDPYCRVRIGHAVFETPTASSGAKAPRWNKTVQCYLPNGVEHAYVEIFDEKTFQGDDRIAWAHIPIPDQALNGEVVDDWYPLSGKQGEEKEGMINIIFSFTPADPVQMAPQQSMMPQVVMMPSAPGMYPTFQPSYQMIPQPMAMAGGMPMQPAVQMQPGVHMQSGVPMQPPQAMQVQQMSEDDLNQCKDMFPNVDMEVIKSVADSQRGNKDATINALLTMND